MRSRPTLHLKLTPEEPRAGDTVIAELSIVGRSRTPIDAVWLRLKGIERRIDGDHEWQHVLHEDDQWAPAFVLGAGEERVLRHEFELPLELPRSFFSASTVITYQLEVCVDIPWWPDAEATWSIPVLVTPAAPQPGAGTFLSHADGPEGTELALEVALDATEFLPGAEVTGRVCAVNASHHRVSRLEVTLLSLDRPVERRLMDSSQTTRFDSRTAWSGQPQEGVAYPFELVLPGSARPTIHGVLSRLEWRVEARAVIPRGRDRVLAPEILVHAPGSPGAASPASPQPAPPLGSERRAQVWASVAEQCGLSAAKAAEGMTGQFGEVALAIALELRKGRLWLVATLAWPDQRLEVEVNERRLLDGFGDSAPTGDVVFDRRFTSRARDLRQREALLSLPVRAALQDFERVALDDQGAVLSSPGNGYEPSGLLRFARAAVEAASQLALSLSAVRGPVGLDPCAAAWSTLAVKLGGTFCRGDFSIRAMHRGVPVELVTRFDGPNPVGTVVRVLLASPPAEPLSPEAQRQLASAAAELERLELKPDALEATLPCPLPSPEVAELSWRALERLARALAPAPK